MHFLFIMDPIDQINIEADTTFALMEAAQNLGHKVYWSETKDFIFNHNFFLKFHKGKVVRDQEKPFIEESIITTAPDNLDAIFIRKDPPFDLDYLHSMQLLASQREFIETQESEDKEKRIFPVTLNDPNGLCMANEKIYPLQFKDLMPPTYIGSNRLELFVFLTLMGTCVMKPIDGHGGEGVVMLKTNDSNCRVLIDMWTKDGTQPVIVQKYIPEARLGDKRILLVDGEPLGALLRVPSGQDHRGNLHVGGTAKPATLTRRDLEICSRIKPYLKKHGLFFVGIDVIGEYLTEINVTSPTGIQEMSRFDDIDYATRVIHAVELKVPPEKKTRSSFLD